MATTTKIVFLDIDDVLNTLPTREHGELFDAANVEALNKVLDSVPVEIVLTTCWRLSASVEEWEEILDGAGVHAQGRVIGVTPWLEGCPRGAEIADWLEHAPCAVTDYAILDDRDDMGPCMGHLLQTTPQYGLTHDLASKAINRLGSSGIH